LLSETLLEDLNPEQRRAVETTEGPVLVVAGAGSGKTRVLTRRIGYLIGVCSIPQDSVLAVTFTNKAAGEMRERVAKLLPTGAGNLWLGTFHSIGVRILRRDIGHLGLSRGFTIYDDADSLGAVKEALRRKKLDPRTWEPRQVRWRIDQWKNQAILPGQAQQQARDEEELTVAELYHGYQKLLTDANALDFGDLLLQTLQLFERFPQVLAHYQRRWQYVLVDEYQDTNQVQYRLVNLLTQNHQNLCVVGDPDQSIYAWRGADVRNILDFERDYENATVVKLERNYRSTQPILSGASAMVANNEGRVEKELFTEKQGGDPIGYFAAADDRQESQFVVHQIRRAVSDGERSYGDFAILYRTNSQSRLFEEELLRYDIPYAVVGGVRFYARAEVKDALAYLRLIVNPTDDQAVRRIVNKPARGIGKTTLERASELAEQRGIPLIQGLYEYAQHSGGRTSAKVSEFLKLISGLTQDCQEKPVYEALAALLDRSGYLHALEKETTPDAEARLDNLRELMVSAEDFHRGATAEPGDEDRSDLELYLDQVSLVSDLDDYEQRSERVSLMTAHSAKGLEFPCVFIVGMEEGVFPHANSSRDRAGVEEERRLFYVAMTRAMERLMLTSADERRRFGSSSYQSPSRFLEEVPDSLMDVARAPSPRRAPQRKAVRGGDSGLDYSYSQEGPVSSEDLGEGPARGMRVRHAVFGEGTIAQVSGTGLSQKLKIEFDRVGMKTVMVRYANLEPA
jgi:DNA helicase-2/ATP-dependent DNA helicase PcrA